IHRALHVDGRDAARLLARECLAKYRGRHPLYFADIVGCNAWLDTMSFGSYSEETRADLNFLDELGFAGLRAILVAQGFLTQDRLMARRYGRSVVIASIVSAIMMMRAPIGISLLTKPSGYPDPSKFS